MFVSRKSFAGFIFNFSFSEDEALYTEAIKLNELAVLECEEIREQVKFGAIRKVSNGK